MSMTLLAACSQDNSDKLESGIYIPQKITVQLTEAENSPMFDSQKNEALRSEIEAHFTDSYFQVNADAIEYFAPDTYSQGIITPDNIIITTIATFELIPQSAKKFTLKSLDHDYCPISGCQITLQLEKVAQDSPLLNTLLQSTTETIASDHNATDSAIALSQTAQQIKNYIDTSYWGIIHSITDTLFFKLTPIQSNGLSYGYPTHSIIPPFTLGGISIDPADPEVEVLSFYSDEAPSQEKNGIQTISYLFVVPVTENPNLSFKQLDSDNTRAFSSDQGYIAEDHGGFYAVNYRYFPESQQMIIGLTEGVTLEAVTDHFRALHNIVQNPAQLSSKAITLQDITLPLATLEERYQITLKEMFPVNDVLKQYQQNLSDWLKSSAILVGDAPSVDNGYHTFIRNSFNYHFPELKIKLHTSPLKEILHNLQNNTHDQATDHNKQTLWQDPIFIYNTDPYVASGLSYFKEIQPGITLEIFSSPYQGHTAEKVLFGKLLSQLDLSPLPAVPVEMIPNIGRYSVDQEVEIHQPLSPKGQYQFKEGITDRYGKLVKPRAN
ncbi:hypothetical protein GCM10007162_07280 [Ignatzschineria ureiclastica]|nr:hypothetical protein [Ignatzschineria ureiclastica]GGZ94200.1 hypothetical protein GCM10007162_07280 [Ignatzschineria ureiclastica]